MIGSILSTSRLFTRINKFVGILKCWGRCQSLRVRTHRRVGIITRLLWLGCRRQCITKIKDVYKMMIMPFTTTSTLIIRKVIMVIRRVTGQCWELTNSNSSNRSRLNNNNFCTINNNNNKIINSRKSPSPLL